MTMLVPRDLPIAIVAPCHPHRADRFERGLSLIEEAGWCPEHYPHLLEPRFHLAAPDAPDVVADLFSEDHAPLINIGSGEEVSIRDLADQVRGVVGFTGELVWDSSKPDGTPRKWVDLERLRALGWAATTPLAEGLTSVYQDFLERHYSSA